MPDALSRLTCLTHLSLCGAEAGIVALRGGWDRLRPLTALQDLGLAGTVLHEVPSVLTALTALTRLSLANNPIRRDLRRLGALARLRELDLSGCGLGAPPRALASLSALTSLML